MPIREALAVVFNLGVLFDVLERQQQLATVFALRPKFIFIKLAKAIGFVSVHSVVLSQVDLYRFALGIQLLFKLLILFAPCRAVVKAKAQDDALIFVFVDKLGWQASR